MENANHSLVERIFHDAQFISYLGIELTSCGKGWCETRMKAAPPLRQQHGYVHAGALTTSLTILAAEPPRPPCQRATRSSPWRTKSHSFAQRRGRRFTAVQRCCAPAELSSSWKRKSQSKAKQAASSSPKHPVRWRSSLCARSRPTELGAVSTGRSSAAESLRGNGVQTGELSMASKDSASRSSRKPGWLWRSRAQRFQRRMESSLPAGRIASACSKHRIASSKSGARVCGERPARICALARLSCRRPV